MTDSDFSRPNHHLLEAHLRCLFCSSPFIHVISNSDLAFLKHFKLYPCTHCSLHLQNQLRDFHIDPYSYTGALSWMHSYHSVVLIFLSSPIQSNPPDNHLEAPTRVWAARASVNYNRCLQTMTSTPSALPRGPTPCSRNISSQSSPILNHSVNLPSVIPPPNHGTKPLSNPSRPAPTSTISPLYSVPILRQPIASSASLISPYTKLPIPSTPVGPVVKDTSSLSHNYDVPSSAPVSSALPYSPKQKSTSAKALPDSSSSDHLEPIPPIFRPILTSNAVSLPDLSSYSQTVSEQISEIVPTLFSTSAALKTGSTTPQDQSNLSDVLGYIDDLAEGHHYEDISNHIPDQIPTPAEAPSSTNQTPTENSMDAFAHMPFLNAAPTPRGVSSFSNPIYDSPNSSYMGFIRKPSTISCTHKSGSSMVMDPRRWVAPKSPTKTPHPITKSGQGPSHDKMIPHELSPITKPPLAHVQLTPSDEKQMDFQTDSCGIMNNALQSFSNIDFIEDVRNPPFVPSSVTLDYSVPLPPINVTYVDPPFQFADPAPVSFSSPSPEALTIDLKTRDKGKRPFRLARFPRKVFKNSKTPLMSESLNTPPPKSPEASPSKPYSQYHSESDSN
jgi:hypothetical protein